MKTLVIASKNPVKAQAALNGFQKMFPGENFQIEMVTVASHVANQPLSHQETQAGAANRAQNAMQAQPHADYWIGIEGGIEAEGSEMTAFAWVVVMSGGRIGRGCTGTFFLPEAVTKLIRLGKELGEADDIVFGRDNSKQENGAVGLLTGDVLDRAQFYEQAVLLALIPFRNPDLYPAESHGLFIQ